MENTQLLSVNHIENEPHNLAVYVNYTLEGSTVETWIRYEDLASFINESLPHKHAFKALSGMLKTAVSFENDDVAFLDDDSLQDHIHGFLFKNLSIALRIENRKLKDKIATLESAFKTGVKLMEATLVDPFTQFHNEALTMANQDRATGQITMCKTVLDQVRLNIEWFKNRL